VEPHRPDARRRPRELDHRSRVRSRHLQPPGGRTAERQLSQQSPAARRGTERLVGARLHGAAHPHRSDGARHRHLRAGSAAQRSGHPGAAVFDQQRGQPLDLRQRRRHERPPRRRLGVGAGRLGGLLGAGQPARLQHQPR
jgi:hypothetical protein